MIGASDLSPRALLCGALYLLAWGAYVAVALDVGAPGIAPGAILGACVAAAGAVGRRHQGVQLQGEDFGRAAAAAAALLTVATALIAVGGVLAIIGPLVALVAIAAAWALLGT